MINGDDFNTRWFQQEVVDAMKARNKLKEDKLHQLENISRKLSSLIEVMKGDEKND